MAYTQEEIDHIFESTDGRCHICRRRLHRRSYRRTWEIDHSVARARGGSDYVRNLRPACISCNRSKGETSSRAARRWFGHTRAPMSKKSKQKRQAWGAAIGGSLGSLLGPWGALLGAAAGYVLGGDDDDSPRLRIGG